MKHNEERKPDRKKNCCKNKKQYNADDDSYSQQKLNKQFKLKKRSLQDEDDSWEEWENYR